MNIAVLGGGSWGTTVASLTARNAPTLLWARNSDTVDEINKYHTNSRYLKEAKLYGELQARYTIKETCLLYTSPSPRDKRQSRMPSSA